MKWFKSPTGNPDPLAFTERLERTHFGENYTPVDLYRDLRKVFLSTPEGRRVLYWILDLTGFYKAGFDPEKPETLDPNLALINTAKRDLGLFILTTLNADPTGFPTE